LTGSAPRKEQNPAVPYAPDEIAEEAWRCFEEGASVVHLHARDLRTGARSPEVAAYRDIYQAVRARCPDLIVNITTSGTPSEPEPLRLARIVELRPEMASLTTSSLNFARVDWKTGEVKSEFLFTNTFEQIARYARTMREVGTKPECELFDYGGLYNSLLVRKQGVFAEPMHFQIVFGVAGGIPFDLDHLAKLRSLIPDGATWSVCGVGRQQFQAGMVAAVSGGHIRVGLEDNIRMPDGALARGSWEQVRWAAQVARLAGREPASPDEAREILRIPAR
jgi:3-keto-5-aminohexanoate cleavage enzyme